MRSRTILLCCLAVSLLLHPALSDEGHSHGIAGKVGTVVFPISCNAAAQQINASGGIVGHKLQCPTFDTKGDPADAVPVTNRILVSNSHLGLVVGQDGSDIPPVLPLLVVHESS